ncbi:MAG: nuclear pore complex subunit [Bacteroidetes bacterium]|nr:MAG: nuclear pore complex subunit [Bacteroidota bacterium]
MDKISIEPTPKTPLINFDPDKGHIEIRGRSIPENSLEFYKELLEWLDEYGNNPQAKTNVEVQLEYFNTSSSKCILDVFKALEGIHKKGGTEMVIHWYYEEDDEDMLEAGGDYEAIVTVPFEKIAIEEE